MSAASIMRAVRDELAAGNRWDDWLKAGGADCLARVRAFFAREASIPRHRPRFENHRTPAGAPYQLATFPQQPAPAGSAPALALQFETDSTGRTVFRLRPSSASHRQ